MNQNNPPFHGIQSFGEKTAVIDQSGTHISYSDFCARADDCAHILQQERGLVAIEAANEMEPVLAFVGACRAGCPVLLLGEGDLEAKPDLRARFQPDFEFYRRSGRWAMRQVRQSSSMDLHHRLSVLLSTSGSTGSAKLVRLSRQNIISNARSIIEYLEIKPDDRAITCLPFHYSFGMSILTSHLMAGSSIVLSPHSVMDKCFWDQFRRHEATSFSGVPRTFEILAQTGFLDQTYPSLRSFTQAGGRLAPETIRSFSAYARKNHARFFVMYGQTEASPRMSYLPPHLAEDNPDCIGIPIPGGEFYLIDEKGSTIKAPDIPGELCFKGPNVMMGYAYDRECFVKGSELSELRTGDIALCKANGLYRIVGRTSRFVKIAGLRLALDDIEELLRKDKVTNCVAGTDEGIVVAVSDPGVDPDRLKSNLLNRLKVPASALVVVPFDELPFIANGKPDYKTILQAGAQLKKDDRPASLKAKLAAILEREDLLDHETFISAGGDSLSFVEASIIVEDYLGQARPGWERTPIGQLCSHKMEGAEVPEPGLDNLMVARAIAIGLAMSSHAFLQFGVWSQLPELARLVTRVATPAFLIIFGMGLARSYLERDDGSRLRTTYRRMFPKALSIYMAIALTQVCALIGGKSHLGATVKVLAFNNQGRFVDVLMIYCSLYLLTPLLLFTLRRWRVPGLLVLFALPWLARPMLMDFTGASYCVAYFTGAGGLVGPSVLHATSFVMFGYCLGGAFRHQRAYAWAALTAVLLAAGTIIAFLSQNSLHDFVHGMSNMEYRRTNHPVFFAYGALASLLILGASHLISRSRLKSERWKILFGLGANSIFAFTFGNMVLNLGPSQSLPLWQGLPLSAVFLGILTLLTHDVMRTTPQFFGPLTTVLRAGMQQVLGVGKSGRLAKKIFPVSRLGSEELKGSPTKRPLVNE